MDREEIAEEGSPEDVDVDDLLGQLRRLERTVDSGEERREVREARFLAKELSRAGFFGERIRKYTTRDMAEAFVGAVIFSVPLLVEDGVYDIARHFAGAAGGVPVFFSVNAGFVVLVTYGLIYWADLQQVRNTRPVLGFVPRRLIGVLLISFLTAGATMTLWGRVHWTDPWVAVTRISVVWTVAAFGAALGDILPGESSGQDIGEVLDELG